MAAPSTKSRTNKSDEKDANVKETKSSGEQVASKEKEEAEAKRETERLKKAREKAEEEAKVRQSKIDSGELVVTSGVEFEAGTKETRVYGQVAEIVDALRDSESPLIFSDVVEGIGAKYPEDLMPAMHALEHVGLVTRYNALRTGEGSANRRTAGYSATDALRNL